MTKAEILWHCAALSSAEHCVLSQTDAGWTIRGITVAPIGDVPAHIEFEITTSPDWLTETAAIQFHGTRAGSYDIRSDSGVWTVNGEARYDLAGCVDIDLGWSPATNVLPIRRLGLEVGATATTTVAWFKFPELTLERHEQHYSRIDDFCWNYRSGPSNFDLTVDERGLVVAYGDDLWRAVATHS